MRVSYATKTGSTPASNYFRSQSFRELDRMQIYMFKVYQMTQKVCYNSYQKIIIGISNTLLGYSATFTVLYLLLFCIWVYRIPL